MATLQKAFGYQDDVMNLPVADIDVAIPFYTSVLGFHEISRSESPHRSVVLARDSVQIGLAENGGDASQDGAAFHVQGLHDLLGELNANGLDKPASAIERETNDSGVWNVFYVVAPDGLCYWFGERRD
jgi:lactoylglutathione lyase